MTKNNTSDDLLKVRLCALLHDIGKPICWSVRKPWSYHVEFGFKILEKTFGTEIAKMAVSHHTTRSYHAYYHPETAREKTVSLADHISSGTDRPAYDESQYGTGPFPSLPVVITHPLADRKTLIEVQGEELIKFTEQFKSRFTNAKVNEETFDDVYHFLSDSVMTKIPADTRYPNNDVSLFDHLRLTAAIANCIWTQGFRSQTVNAYKFSLISGDTNRISSFINRSPRLPDLRAGSMIVSHAVKETCESIRKQKGTECVIYEGGGGFLALSDSGSAHSIIKNANLIFRKMTMSDLSISITSLEATGEDIQKAFPHVWYRSISAMHNQKLTWNDIPPNVIEDEIICDICRLRKASYKEERSTLINTLPSFENLCQICKTRREIGKTGGRTLNELIDSNGLVAILKMDGDDMGEIFSGDRIRQLGKQPTPSRIATISRLVHTACEKELAEIVKNQSGIVIYSGGDDLLAVLPGRNVFNCAVLIQKTFEKVMEASATISAGISIFYHKFPFYVGLATATDCLSAAKKNALKSSISFEIEYGLSLPQRQRKVYNWNDFKRILNIVEFMGAQRTARVQVREIAKLAGKSKTEAGILIKYKIGSRVIDRDTGNELLRYLNEGMLADAYMIYNVLRKKSVGQ